MAAHWSLVFLYIWISMHFLLGFAEYLTSDITFRIDERFCLVWDWNPPEKMNCTVTYTSNILSRNISKTSRRNKIPRVEVHVSFVDLNEESRLEVQAQCDDNLVPGNKKVLGTQLATGDINTVRNFSCVWYNLEYINCTWEPGQEAPTNVNYTLVYWSSYGLEPDCHGASPNQGKEFQDWLRHGTPCQTYSYTNAVPTGCQFPFLEELNTFVKLVIAVADWSRNYKPYFYYVKANNIVKLKTPVIQGVYRTKNQSIYITWKDLNITSNLLHEVLIEKSNSKRSINYVDVIGLSKEMPNAQSDVTYTVKVRVRLPTHVTDPNMYLWSDWSEPKILPGEDDGRTVSLLLLLLIPAIVIIAAVLLLIYIRRLKILIFPRIPDPGRVLSNDLQQWIKSGRLAYSEPRKEEICPVSLLENSPTPPYEE